MSGITPAMLEILSGPTPPERIKTRPGQGSSGPLSYVDARFVMDRLDEVGPENWQDRYEDRTNGTVRCGIGINVEGEWVWKWDVGTESNIEEDKGAYSDAFKRAAVKWGIARDLYDHPTTSARPGPPATSRTGTRTPASPNPAQAAPRPESGSPGEPPLFDDLDEDIERAVAVARGAVKPPENRPLDPRDGYYGPTCPKHINRPWKETKFGPKCTAQDEDGKNGYCIWRPSKRWVAEHEVPPAA